jgi:Glyoxalase-like domain
MEAAINWSISRSDSSTMKKRRSSTTPCSVIAIDSRASRPRPRTGAMFRRVTWGMERCYRTGRLGGVHPYTMLLGIDHIVIACAHPDAAAEALERVFGLGAAGGGRHEALGTFNRLVWLGDTYLELIGVFDRALAKRSWIGAPTLRALDGGGGLATWAVATDDIEGDVARLNAGGAGLAEPIAGERVRLDGRVVRWRLSLPRELSPERPPFLIEHDASAAEWSAADRAARAAQVHRVGGRVRLAILELPIADMPATIAGLMRAIGIGPFRPSLAGGGTRDASVGDQTLRLRPTRTKPAQPDPSWPVATVHLVAGVPSERRMATLLGCRFVLGSS